MTGQWKKVGLTVGVAMAGLALGYCTTGAPSTPDPNPALVPARAIATPERVPRTPEPILPPADELIEAFEDHYHPFLDDEPSDVSVSVGTVTNGYLVGGRQLPMPGRTYAILDRQRNRRLMYGTDELIDVLLYAADTLHTRHGTLLWLGNIGRRRGGDIPYSVSHNSGRDVDIAFCYTDPHGQPVDPPDLVHLDSEGYSEKYDGYYRFDAARTWTVIEALLTYDKVQVQYLFVANPLKRMLMAHARRKGVRGNLLARADAILGQPGRAAPHNDHLHVRLYCSKDDVASGCENGGRTHAGVDLFLGARSRRVSQMVRRLEDPEAEQRARAIERLRLLRVRARVPEIARRLGDPSPRVRSAAATAVGALGTQSDAQALAARFASEDVTTVQRDLVFAAQDLGGVHAGRMLSAIIADPAFDQRLAGPMPRLIEASFTRPEDQEFALVAEGSETDVAVNGPMFEGAVIDLTDRELSIRLAAVEASANLERPEPVPALVEALASPDPVLRARVARALGRLTNHRFGVAWARADLSQDDREQGVEAWRGWLAEHGKRNREFWLARGFRQRGYEVRRIRIDEAWDIVPAIRDDDHLTYNAQRTLMRLTDHWPRSLNWSRGDACWHWTRWLGKNRRKFRLPEAPSSLAECNR
jgi:murein endopeptidase